MKYGSAMHSVEHCRVHYDKLCWTIQTYATVLGWHQRVGCVSEARLGHVSNASWGRLGCVLESSWMRLGIVLELDASWMRLGIELLASVVTPRV